MFDIFIEIIRAIMTGGIVCYLYRQDRRYRLNKYAGWHYMFIGFCLLFMASVLDVTDNVDSLAKYVIIGDTVPQAILEKIFGYLCSSVFILIGFIKFIPVFTDLERTRNDLKEELEKRSKLENSLSESEDKFRQIVENITDVYFETGLDGVIYYCSPSCLDFSGYSQDELIGQNATILYNDPNDRELLLGAMQKEGRVRNLELVFKTKDGDLCDVALNGDFIYDESDKPTKLSGTIRDITKINKVKEQVQRARKMEAIGLMAGGVAHDLNNILSGIVGYPDLLLKNLPNDSDLRKPLLAIHESGQRATTVVADLLTVARGAASIREGHNLNSLIEEYIKSPECKNLMQLHPNITCHSKFEATYPAILCSPVHVKKCLMNLWINAYEAIVDSGTVTVSTHNQTIDAAAGEEYKIAAGEYVVLGFCDNGSGISDYDLNHIFEPFYTKKKMGRSGTGLGLAVVWNTMEDHKGTVLVESSDAGTCFNLYFPVEKNICFVHTHDDHVESSNSSESILIVDDEPQLRDIASQMLQAMGYTVDSVSSGELAVEFIKKKQVDLILIDMLMEPGINGRQTYEEIIKFSPKQKAVIASGFSETDDVKATLKLGAGGFIKKPYTMDQLGRAIRDALEM